MLRGHKYVTHTHKIFQKVTDHKVLIMSQSFLDKPRIGEYVRSNFKTCKIPKVHSARYKSQIHKNNAHAIEQQKFVEKAT